MEAVQGLLETYVSLFRRSARPPVDKEPIYLSVSGADVGSRRLSHNLAEPTEIASMVLRTCMSNRCVRHTSIFYYIAVRNTLANFQGYRNIDKKHGDKKHGDF